MSRISSTSTITTTTKTSRSTLSSLNTNEREYSIKSEHTAIDRKSSIAAITDLVPLKKELKLHCERILCILDTTIAHLKISVCLSRLLRSNACMLRRYLTSQQVDYVQNVCMKYTGENKKQKIDIKKRFMAEKISSVVKNISQNLDETKRMISGKLSFPVRDVDDLTDPQMGQVMDILWNNCCLRQKILEEFELMPPNDVTVLVHYLRDLREIMENKLTTTSQQERIRERKLRISWLRKNRMEENVDQYKGLIEQQREKLGNVLQNKHDLIAKHLNKIEELKVTLREQLRRRVLESEKAMVELSVESELRQEELGTQVKLVTQQYENLLTQNMAAEKKIRSRRIKIEAQLSNWLNKYDADIGERNAEFEAIDEKCEKEKAHMKKIQELFDEQEEEYLVLFEEKEEEDQQAWEEKAYLYLMNRSARKIQRCWKAYRQRKIERKMAKKS
ncbi:hypothetical protein ILUMI_04008 [Ignelater luminosus]|uniref:Dynein regulatory complex protein 10 n=1 Tax=Ignelater luminosus TaxID=2038154 RepID=A0A8K0GJY7_IGNLU|nr:hypothetical protein ILUMI_04008 [Ignelater luminosus]